jgi:2-hydroxy-6-oxonona-2,4-dienedioate hydrolase/4,5:9,10-diseco-3-hydroxy-5,9,17-trioxoandrosta-1(10),2-diene-4-oate hydrolase
MRLFCLSIFGLLLMNGSVAPGAQFVYQGVPIYYSDFGAGPAVVQVHGIGAGASSEQVKYQTQALVSAGYRVYSVDLAGYGQSIRPQQLFTGGFMAAMLTAFVDQLPAGPVAMIGHSLGGTYAIAVAAARPERVNALILNAPVGAIAFTEESNAETAQRWQNLVTSDGGKVFYAALGSWRNLKQFCVDVLYVDNGYCSAPTVQDYYQYTQVPASIYGAAAFLTGNLGLNVRDEFAALQARILLVYGARNRLTGIGEMNEFLKLNGNARLVVIPQAGPIVNDEKSAEFNQLVLGELAAAGARR